MPRLNVVDPSEATGRVKEIFDGPLKGKELNIFKGLANSPAGLEGYLGLAGALGHGGLTKAEQEAVALAIAEANDCDYCRAAHTFIGKEAGLTEAQTVAARRGAVEGDAKLDALVRFTLRLHEKKGFVSADDLRDFKAAGYDDGHVVDVVVAYTLNTLTNYFNHVNDTAVDLPAPPALG
jgi:uncharacterized peroxidase-related enzyme